MLRIMLMLVLSWTTLLLLNTIMLVVPASIGRAVFNAIPYPEDFNVVWHNGTRYWNNFIILFLSKIDRELTNFSHECPWINHSSECRV